MEKERHKNSEAFCPVGRFFSDLEESFGKSSKFYGHLKNSRIEFLKAIRSIVDEKIEDLEKQSSGKKQRSKKINVE